MALSLDLTDDKTKTALSAKLPTDGSKPSLVGMSKDELLAVLADAGIPQKQLKMRVSQIWHWLYIRGVSDFADMKNLSKDFRALLEEKFDISRPKIVEEQISNDGTRKWLMQFPSLGAGKPVEVETVYIPEEGRGTLCISSQVGCTLTCSFCHTGTQKACTQPHFGRDFAAIAGSARSSRRLSRQRHPCRSHRSLGRSQGLQHCYDGNGRTPL